MKIVYLRLYRCITIEYFEALNEIKYRRYG